MSGGERGMSALANHVTMSHTPPHVLPHVALNPHFSIFNPLFFTQSWTQYNILRKLKGVGELLSFLWDLGESI